MVDADGLSHFDAINNLYSLPSSVMGLSEEDSETDNYIITCDEETGFCRKDY